MFPICEGRQPLAVLDAIARPGASLGEKDFMLLKDLVQLASNVIKNARSHWRMSQEKLTVDRILDHLRPFVPSTVQKIVEKDPAAPDLEKKDIDVTVLFLDVAGYTRISETQSRDKVTFIIEKYFSSFLDIIYDHGGDINETAGDGLMVIFQGEPEENRVERSKSSPGDSRQDAGDQRRIEESIPAGRSKHGYQLRNRGRGNEPIHGNFRNQNDLYGYRTRNQSCGTDSIRCQAWGYSRWSGDCSGCAKIWNCSPGD